MSPIYIVYLSKRQTIKINKSIDVPAVLFYFIKPFLILMDQKDIYFWNEVEDDLVTTVPNYINNAFQ